MVIYIEVLQEIITLLKMLNFFEIVKAID